MLPDAFASRICRLVTASLHPPSPIPTTYAHSGKRARVSARPSLSHAPFANVAEV